MDRSILVIKFSDDTTVEGCIENEDEMASSEEVQRLIGWCMDNNLELNILKTKEMIIDFSRKKTQVCPPSINGVIVGQVLQIPGNHNF